MHRPCDDGTDDNAGQGIHERARIPPMPILGGLHGYVPLVPTWTGCFKSHWNRLAHDVPWYVPVRSIENGETASRHSLR
jgi:hypothetical protein